MSIIQKFKTKIEGPSAKKYTVPVRIWHGANVVVISGSILAVLINATLTSKNTLGSRVKSELFKGGININEKQAKAVVHAIRDNVWGSHIIFGYFLVVFLILRLATEILPTADKKFIAKIKIAYSTFHTIRKNRQASFHDLAVKIFYGMAYATLAVSGLLLAFKNSIPSFKSFIRYIKQVHCIGMYNDSFYCCTYC
jgi:Ni/Fe-hydrogenase 1 B-type cytochrome subunit